MHAAYKEEDERVLQHAGEEELACHCRLRPRGGGAHGGCRGGSQSRARRARKPGADAESTFDTYLQMMGMTMDDLRAQSKTAAERNVRSDLALEAVVAAENIEVGDGEVDEEIAKLAEQYKMETDKVRELVSMDDLRLDLSMRKALDLVKGAVKKPAKKKAKAKDDEAKEETKEEEQ